MGLSIELGVMLSVFSALLGYLAFSRNKKQDDTGTGITLGTIMAKLDFMSSNILDIKTNIKDINNRQDKFDDKLALLDKRVAVLESKIKDEEE